MILKIDDLVAFVEERRGEEEATTLKVILSRPLEWQFDK